MGNILATSGSMASTLGAHNPLRYRGYVYDTETELYYLHSRYYNPAVGRYINTDAFPATGQGMIGNNMHAYCNNSPVFFADASGQFGLLSSIAIGALFGVATQFISSVVSNAMEGKTGAELFSDLGTPGEYITAALTGAICAVPGAGALVSVVCDVAAPAVEQGLDYVIRGDEWSWEEYSVDTLSNLACDAVSNVVSIDAPEFIRDIKKEAQDLGKKGTKQLTKYLTKAQNQAFIGNQLLGVTTSIAQEVYVGAAKRLISVCK